MGNDISVFGGEGLKTTQKLSTYSAETKRNTVCDYLPGKGTLRAIQKNIRYLISRYINGYENINPMELNYYNNHRYQKRLNCMTLIEYRNYLENTA